MKEAWYRKAFHVSGSGTPASSKVAACTFFTVGSLIALGFSYQTAHANEQPYAFSAKPGTGTYRAPFESL